MTTRTALLLASALFAASTALSGCGLASSIPGGGGRDVPVAVGPASPVTVPGTGSDPGTGAGGNAGGGAPSTDGPGASPGDGTGQGGNVMPPGGVPDNPTIVTVHPGQADPRDVSVVQLTSLVAISHHVIVRVRWWGGIEPCEILDSVVVTRDGTSFTIAARVGSAPGGQVGCIDIARDTATLVDLGVLPAGTYSVKASTGDALPISIVVP
jgi:hypothetical protein